MTTTMLDFEIEMLPGGQVNRAEDKPQVILWVYEEHRTIIHLPGTEALKRVITTAEERTLFFMPIAAEDVPALAVFAAELSKARAASPRPAPSEVEKP